MGFHQTFKALSDPTRRAILEQLKHGRLTAGEIASAFELSAATVSHHLAMLRQGRTGHRPAGGQVHLLRNQHLGHRRNPGLGHIAEGGR